MKIMTRTALLIFCTTTSLLLAPRVNAIQPPLKPRATPIPIAPKLPKALPEVPADIEPSVHADVPTDVHTDAPVEMPTDNAVILETGAPPVPPKPTLGQRAHGVVSEIGSEINYSREYRIESPITLMLEWSPIDLIIPSKIGGSVSWNQTAEHAYELEYLSASLSAPFIVKDLGGFTDRRISFMKRSFNERNSFNFHYGLSYFDTEIRVGNQYLSQATGRPSNVDLLSVKSLGFIWGIGSRWNLKYGITLGVDWFSWAQPLIVTERKDALTRYISDQSTKNTLNDALSIATYFPRFTLLKVGIGYSF